MLSLTLLSSSPSICFLLLFHSVHTMHTPSSTSPPTTPLSYASCAVTSSNSLIALIRCAGGVVAMGTWATSRRSTSSLFTNANDLTRQSNQHHFSHGFINELSRPCPSHCPSAVHLPINFGRQTTDELLLNCSLFNRLLLFSCDVTCRSQASPNQLLEPLPLDPITPLLFKHVKKIQKWSYTLWRTHTICTQTDKLTQTYTGLIIYYSLSALVQAKSMQHTHTRSH